ncbi:methyltransferase domain-containing protein [Alkalihalophilus lindianensis]|uniref:Methyltransferase domain-containing protein n=1 Tax=Alkalihalophilus lindianensis TaxID=1630542 RepID=A0ABU3XBF9_9BACI|nr:methyltransferase domain-containing protein [Alkalihalophilus lindianensis]MDV2685219.1 methyltransferase domain-containing protein [Alkalihalophilus lindianensis]
MAHYKCTYCSFQYNEWHGDTKNGVPQGTSYSALAGTLCSRCGLQGERHKRQSNPKYAGLEAKYYDFFVGKSGNVFYRNWVLQSDKVPNVLDLGTGTGRFALELSNLGIPITGVDWSSEMLAVARKKVERMNNEVNFIEEDALTFNQNERYSHILLTDGFFQHFTTVLEQKELLARVRKHLKKDGFVAIDLVIPPTNPTWKVQQRKQVTNQKTIYYTVEGTTALHGQLIHYTATYESFREGVCQSKYRVERELSLLTPRELIYLLMLEGFFVLDMVENYQPSIKLSETMKIPEINYQSAYLGVNDTLELKSDEINKGILQPYQLDSWNEGGYPFGVSAFEQSYPTKWTIIAKSN